MQPRPFSRGGGFVVVVGVDWSSASVAAFEAACALAEWSRSAVVHVMRVVRVEPDHAFEERRLTDLLEERLRLDRLCLEQATSGHVRIVRHVTTGRPETAIVELARDETADVVVIGTRHRGGMDRLLLGSVTDRIVHTAPCHVLVVPEWGREGGPPRVTGATGAEQ